MRSRASGREFKVEVGIWAQSGLGFSGLELWRSRFSGWGLMSKLGENIGVWLGLSGCIVGNDLGGMGWYPGCDNQMLSGSYYCIMHRPACPEGSRYLFAEHLDQPPKQFPLMPVDVANPIQLEVFNFFLRRPPCSQFL
mmetsp:Transcript_6479/g.10258  ORF Transcript_6479/g.10258 Transcript_6479/m.10258 type:complete len:138 (+) Transcript_6479:955-1368(+)